jgi:hypothetical protein
MHTRSIKHTISPFSQKEKERDAYHQDWAELGMKRRYKIGLGSKECRNNVHPHTGLVESAGILRGRSG